MPQEISAEQRDYCLKVSAELQSRVRLMGDVVEMGRYFFLWKIMSIIKRQWRKSSPNPRQMRCWPIWSRPCTTYPCLMKSM